MFTAYGIAGIIGPQLAGYFKDFAHGSGSPGVWMTPFIIAGVACLAGSIIMKLTHPPQLEIEKEEALNHKLRMNKA